jgi:hypothetical protein
MDNIWIARFSVQSVNPIIVLLAAFVGALSNNANFSSLQCKSAATRPASAGAQTAAYANAQIGSLAHGQVSSQRVGGAMETYMYIGFGTILIIIVLFLILR